MVNYKKYFDIEIFEGKISKHAYPWHFHNCYTLIVVKEGANKYEFQNNSLQVDACQALIIEPFQIHRNTISSTTFYKALFIPIDYFEEASRHQIKTVKFTQPTEINKINTLINKIELIDSENELKELVVKSFEMLYQLTIKKNDDKKSLLISPKIDYDLTINELAEKAHLSKYHFQRKFKKNNGLTIGQLKQQEKTIIAKTLLENGKPSTAVAHELGFFDQSHFIKYFKKMWATTPKKFK